MNKPNIIYVLADQFRNQAMGFWSKPEYENTLRGTSDPVHTPNLDQFADESIVFNQAISNYPVCSPYRGMLMSGCFPEQNGVPLNCKAGRDSSLREDLTCFTDVLADQGYSIGYLGKFHLDKPEPCCDQNGNYIGENGQYYTNGSGVNSTSCWDMITPPGPKRHGVDYWYSYGTFDVHKNPHYWDNNCIKHEPHEWSPKHEVDKAISYINNTENQRDDNQPFCLFVSMNPPHTPYGSVNDTDSDVYYQHYAPSVVSNTSDLLNRPNVESGPAYNSIRYYLSHVTGVDKHFGRILSALEAAGEKDNTIVVFSSDHGEMMGSHGLMAKNVPYNESMNIPFLLRYPEKLSHRVEDLLIGGPDVMPTILSLAGLEAFIPTNLDGEDYSDILINGALSQTDKPASAFYMGVDKKGVRTDHYTMVMKRQGTGQPQPYLLFDDEQDVYQMTNLSFDAIDEDDLLFLQQELDYWLEKSNDEWYQEGIKIAPEPGNTAVTISCHEDAYIRDGSKSGDNYGSSQELIVKDAPAAGYTRQSLMKFSLAGVTDVTQAVLKLKGLNSQDQSSVTVECSSIDPNWDESTLTWDTANISNSNLLASTTVTATETYYQWNVTTYIQEQINAGNTELSFLLAASEDSRKALTFQSKESTDGPKLVIQTAS